MGTRNNNARKLEKLKLYTSKEKRGLVDRLIEMRNDVSWTAVYNNSDIAAQIPSRRTLYRIFEDPYNCQIRDSTARQIERLLTISEHGESNAATHEELMPKSFSVLRRLMGVSEKTSQRFLENYSGCYKCVRITTASRQILVTHLRIKELIPNIPAFTHIEAIPDEASELPDRGQRILRHEGVILARQRRATFLAPSGGLRQMTCVISTNQTRPAFSGLLLSVDAKHEFPFAARVFLTQTGEINDQDVSDHPEYGLFAVDDPHYSAFLPYVVNAVIDLSVLSPETDV